MTSYSVSIHSIFLLKHRIQGRVRKSGRPKPTAHLYEPPAHPIPLLRMEQRSGALPGPDPPIGDQAGDEGNHNHSGPQFSFSVSAFSISFRETCHLIFCIMAFASQEANYTKEVISHV